MEDAYLALGIAVYGSIVSFEFKTEEILLYEVDVLGTQIEDVQEDILEMKMTLEEIEKIQVDINSLDERVKTLLLDAPHTTRGQFISLRATVYDNSVYVNDGYVQWPIVAYNTTPEMFSLGRRTAATTTFKTTTVQKADTSSITVNQAGVYQVHVRFKMMSDSESDEDGYATYLYVNGKTVAQALSCDVQGDAELTVQIAETLVLKANDYLQVTNDNGTTSSTTLNSVFTVLKLA